MTTSLATLITRETVQEIYSTGLRLAETLGLPVTSWSAGDPTRSLYWYLAEILGTLEDIAVGYVASGFLDYAAADPDRYQWLVLLADQVYGYTADEAVAASGVVRLTNNGGGFFPDIAAGDITVKSSTTDATYHNTSGGTLASGAGQYLDLDFVADEAGSGSSAGATEIDTMVTTLLEVTCSNAAAFTGTDAETSESIVGGCKAKLGSLSPNGPADAYDYVALNADLTGTSAVTRSRTYDDSATGDVTVYLAGPSGAVGGADVTAVEAAIVTWATPQCVTPTVASAVNLLVPVTYELWLYDSAALTEAEAATAVSEALAALMLERPIGGDIKAAIGSGRVFHAMIEGVFRSTFGVNFVDVTVTLPAGDTTVAANEVPVLGTVTKTAIHFEAEP